MCTGERSASRGRHAPSKPELSVSISWEVPETGTVSGHHPVSIPVDGTIAWTEQQRKRSFCSCW